MPVKQVVLLLGSCPFPERLDLQWFSTTLAALGPRFHAHAVRAALCVPDPEARIASVLKAVEEGGVPATVALEEMRPAMAGGETGECGEALANQVSAGCVMGWEGVQASLALSQTRNSRALKL